MNIVLHKHVVCHQLNITIECIDTLDFNSQSVSNDIIKIKLTPLRSVRVKHFFFGKPVFS